MPKFTLIKKQLIHCLINGHVLHESRNDIDIKNLLHIGSISIDDVCHIMKKSSGNEYSYSPHHMDADVTVHIVKTRYASQQWYIKWYFIEPDAVFISVHH